MAPVSRELASAYTLLQRHLPLVADPDERAMTADAIGFIEEHPDCLLRSCLAGHLTGSAWVANRDRSRVLLLLHRKLGKWLNPGGHADGESDLANVALREAGEESGLRSVRLASPALYDFDRHWIPERREIPGHYHYDFRFLCEADDREPLRQNEESMGLAWVTPEEALARNAEPSLRRLVAKMRLKG